MCEKQCKTDNPVKHLTNNNLFFCPSELSPFFNKVEGFWSNIRNIYKDILPAQLLSFLKVSKVQCYFDFIL